METIATSSAHTPGPWVLCDNGEIKAQSYIGKWDDYVCQMPFSSLREAGEMGPDHLPNARLIAAAPDLQIAASVALDAMTELLEIGNITEWQRFLLSNAEARIKAALAQAA